jgi:hypothetical protein
LYREVSVKSLRFPTPVFSVVGALELPSCFIVYGIEGETFEVGAPLSAAVAQAVPEVVGRIRRDIRALQAGYT